MRLGLPRRPRILRRWFGPPSRWRRRTRTNGVIWSAILALVLLSIGSQLAAAPDVAFNYWYLLSIPMMIGALRFGLRGAVITSISGVLVMFAVFHVAGQSFGDLTSSVERLILSSTSPQEAHRLALQLADLRSSDPEVTFRRALAGLALVITSSVMLGRAVDARERSTGILTRVVGVLRRYFSPQLVDALTSGAEEHGNRPLTARKEVTILFTDLRGFTAYCEQSEPDAIIRLLNEYFTAMTEEVHRHHGTLDKYIGDAVMAFFGDPEWHPEHADHAFQAAIAMQSRMRELQSLWKAEGRQALAMGIGIATGHVTVGNVGSDSVMGYTAIGSAVNVASRLSSLAAPGQILTTLKTYWRVQPLMDGLLLEPTEVHGFVRPVEIVELLGPRLVTGAKRRNVSQRLLEITSHIADDPTHGALVLANRPEVFSVLILTEEEKALAMRVARLSMSPVFAGLPPAEIATLLEAALVETDVKRTMVVYPEVAEDIFYVVLEGGVEASLLDGNGGTQLLTELGPGECFGELALLFDVSPSVEVCARLDTTFLVLHRDNFYAVLSDAPELRRRLDDLARSRLATWLPEGNVDDELRGKVLSPQVHRDQDGVAEVPESLRALPALENWAGAVLSQTRPGAGGGSGLLLVPEVRIPPGERTAEGS